MGRQQLLSDADIQYQILINQVAIMAGLKSHIMMQSGNEATRNDVSRFDDAIIKTSQILRRIER